jgi:diguanylate cyclase (GGDEF)-like protein
VVGRRAATALREDPVAEGGKAVLGVHEALLSLSTRRAPCVVDAQSLATRPRAALRALSRAASPYPVVVLWEEGGKAPPGVERAVRRMGVRDARGPVEARALLGVSGQAFSAAFDAPDRREDPLKVVKDRHRRRQPPKPAPEGDPSAFEEAEFIRGCFRRLDRPDAMCRYVLRRLSKTSGARRASLMLLDASRSALFVKAAKGLDPTLVGRVRATLGTGVAGRCASLGRAVAGRGSSGGPRAYAGSAYVVLPLGRAGGSEGVASLTDLPGDRLPSREEMRHLRRIALQAGRALEAARRLEHAETLSATDELTGLPNRRSFERALRREMERAKRTGARLGVALLDVDHFKSFNDRFGHPVGDRVLVQIAKRLASAFRETDLVSRWGGEEFAALLTGFGEGAEDEALAVIERARRAVSARPLSLGPGLPSPVASVSGGVAVFPTDAQDAAELLRRADAALYEAKREGRDRVKRA